MSKRVQVRRSRRKATVGSILTYLTPHAPQMTTKWYQKWSQTHSKTTQNMRKQSRKTHEKTNVFETKCAKDIREKMFFLTSQNHQPKRKNSILKEKIDILNFLKKNSLRIVSDHKKNAKEV